MGQTIRAALPFTQHIPFIADTVHHHTLKAVLEDRIERLIRYPDTLSIAEKTDLESTVSTSGYAKAVADYFQLFYQEMDTLDVLPPTSDIHWIVVAKK